ncbi:MAG TPA: SMC-Scp complex subunit ScpB [Thermodesulfobacteriota bacterium]|nr:SMC-Scp complex subunit ScpB [Thermodesulfobacteriota bacterium]
MEDNQIKSILEGLIFVSDGPLSLERMKEVVGIPKRDLQRVISVMMEEYRKEERGFLLTEVADGFQFRTRPDHVEWIRKLKKVKPSLMSQPALETLAIVAYRQPVVRAEVEKIRGVDSGGVLRTLLERKLIKIIGKKDIPGKPLVYGTSKKFLEVFGLKDLSHLPTLKDLESLGPASLEGILPLEGAEQAPDQEVPEAAAPEQDTIAAEAPEGSMKEPGAAAEEEKKDEPPGESSEDPL